MTNNYNPLHTALKGTAAGAAGVTVILGLLLLLFLLLILKPLALIWGVNGLFGLEIPYTFWNFIYAIAIGIGVAGSSSSCKAK